MAAVTDLVLSSHRSLLKRGAVLVDPHDDSTEPACCSCWTTACAKPAPAAGTTSRDVSRRLQFVEMTA
jgi:hypothetical protein